MYYIDDFRKAGDLLFNNARYAEAIGFYSIVLERDACNKCMFNRAVSHYRLGDYSSALSDIESYLKAGYESDHAYYLKAVALYYLNEMQDARDSASKSLEMNPYSIDSVRISVLIEISLNQPPDFSEEIGVHGLIVEKAGDVTRLLTGDRSLTHSQIHLKSPFTGGFWDICLAPIFKNPGVSDVLLVGVAAGTIARQYAYFTESLVDAVDPDTDVFTTCERYFGEKPDRVILHQTDGLSFLQSCGKHYGAIVFDAFSGEGVPPELTNEDTLGMVRERLTENGCFVLNYITPYGPGIKSAIYDRLLSLFPSTYYVEYYSNTLFLSFKEGTSWSEFKKIMENPVDERLKSLGSIILKNTSREGVGRNNPAPQRTT
ncbi:MAG: tetratricopeptide repeat protein [Candidatus Altiarchaeota archaeon]